MNRDTTLEARLRQLEEAKKAAERCLDELTAAIEESRLLLESEADRSLAGQD